MDTETGGLESSEACVIEIGAILVALDGGELTAVDQFDVRLQPDRPVHPKAAEVNGYDEKTWGGHDRKLAFEFFAAWVKESVGGDRAVWGGCNPLFDIDFMTSDMKRARVEFPSKYLSYNCFDVQSLCAPLVWSGELESTSLRNIRKWAGCEGEQSHSAFGDIFDTFVVMQRYLASVTA